MSMWTRMQPAYAANMWNEALNMRLGTETNGCTVMIRDAYMLQIFENNMTRLPNWCNNGDDKLPFCQILGEYKMELPYYNTLEPYTNMNENCPSLPPTYERPVRC
ncbi:hypothetical protein CASFOL_003816 [Castilleja foliolosa]|uniref:Uncharacterized protein n=1 Tax=Castilleja foliolosa TaxID=1961234 RepID=A0ABD3EIA3_9LAMI